MKQKMNLANMQGKLTRDEMKSIFGGVEDEGGCLGIISCSRDHEGESCGPVAPGCTCTKNATIPNDYYCK